jgi:formylglycine-generating enzyme required for sulfatase activity
VGQKQPNGLGIFDMSGNVSEWMQDWYDSHYQSSGNNPVGASSGSNRAFRGGDWYYDAWISRVAARNGLPPNSRSCYLGFRLVSPIQ